MISVYSPPASATRSDFLIVSSANTNQVTNYREPGAGGEISLQVLSWTSHKFQSFLVPESAGNRLGCDLTTKVIEAHKTVHRTRHKCYSCLKSKAVYISLFNEKKTLYFSTNFIMQNMNNIIYIQIRIVSYWR